MLPKRPGQRKRFPRLINSSLPIDMAICHCSLRMHIHTYVHRCSLKSTKRFTTSLRCTQSQRATVRAQPLLPTQVACRSSFIGCKPKLPISRLRWQRRRKLLTYILHMHVCMCINIDLHVERAIGRGSGWDRIRDYYCRYWLRRVHLSALFPIVCDLSTVCCYFHCYYCCRYCWHSKRVPSAFNVCQLWLNSVERVLLVWVVRLLNENFVVCNSGVSFLGEYPLKNVHMYVWECCYLYIYTYMYVHKYVFI